MVPEDLAGASPGYRPLSPPEVYLLHSNPFPVKRSPSGSSSISTTSMVLDNAVDSQEPSSSNFQEPFLSSDADPYASGSSFNDTPPNHLRINPNVTVDLETLPRRWGPLFTRPNPSQVIRGITTFTSVAAHELGRPVTQDEADALAHHTARTIRIASFGTPAGIAISTFHAWRTQESMRFPFWQPFKPGGRFSKDVYGPFRGQSARAIWQVLRFSTYGLVWVALGGWFFASYGIMIGMVDRARDPRLSEYNEVMEKAARRQRGLRGVLEEQGKAQGMPGQAKGETWEMARQRRGVQGRGEDTYDNAPPTGGAFYEKQADGSDSHVVYIGQAQQRGHSNSARSGPSSEVQSDVFDFSSSSSSASTDPTQPSSSAWDRIRQSSMAASQKPEGDSFSFSQQQEDRELARPESQRDFDAKVEREREGRDFEEGGAARRGGGWRR